LNAVVAWILQEVAKSASRLWKLCAGRPSSHIFGAQGGAIWRQQLPQVILDTPAAEFRLPATDGRTYALDDVAGEKGTVVVFICNHCPYVKAVIDRIVADARVLMSEGVGFAAICSNDAASYPEDSFENMKRFAKAHDFPFRYLHDETQTVARGVWGGLYAGLLRLQRQPQAQVPRPARRRPYNSASRGGAPRACRGHACDCGHRCGAG